ncbi:hypothetical protein F5Y12DRAFT_204938 [Xylaria sp. FL1777]|nr:hypothetical protein F5Y12DRAFT_204938 [Xylaria sp. FL1777]
MSDSEDLMINEQLLAMLKEDRDAYDIYSFAAENGIVDDLNSSWLITGAASLKNFTTDTIKDPPHFCFIRITKKNLESWKVVQLAAHTIAIEEEILRSQARNTIFVAQNRRMGATEYEQHWEALVKDVAAKLRLLIPGEIKVNDWDDADKCLKAIEAVTEISSLFAPTQPVLYIAGLDRAYDRTTSLSEPDDGLAPREKFPEPTQSDLDQRAKVKRMVDALIRIFNGKGKLVFAIGPRFRYLDVVESKSMADIPIFQI